MTGEISTTFWIDRLKDGDGAAAQPLWERYFGRLVRLARRRLRKVRGAAADEEDVALSAFHHFCRAAAQGRFPRLHDKDDLWRLLVTITENKASDLTRRSRSARKGGGRVVEASAVAGLAGMPSLQPSPAFAALLADEYRRLFAILEDDRLRELARLKLEGYTNEEIAQRLDCALRTVERKLQLIRTRWTTRGIDEHRR